MAQLCGCSALSSCLAGGLLPCLAACEASRPAPCPDAAKHKCVPAMSWAAGCACWSWLWLRWRGRTQVRGTAPHTGALWRGPCCCCDCCHPQITSPRSPSTCPQSAAACLYAYRPRAGEAAHGAAVRAIFAGPPCTRQLLPLQVGDPQLPWFSAAAEALLALIDHSLPVLSTAPTCGLCLALLQASLPVPLGLAWHGLAGSWAPTWSAAAATASSTPSACTTQPSAAPSCRAAPGPAPAAARSSRCGGQALGQGGGHAAGSAGRHTHAHAACSLF